MNIFRKGIVLDLLMPKPPIVRAFSLDAQNEPMMSEYNIAYYDKYEWGWIEVELAFGYIPFR